jgi:S1-C subfamily serine protease
MKLKIFIILGFTFFYSISIQSQDSNLKIVKQGEENRIKVIERISPSVVCVFGMIINGGGSGVLFKDEGYAITNFHVVQSVGLKGQGGISDGKLYPLDVLGIDPGGDISIVKLSGKDSFKGATLGKSDGIAVGDFVMALGNPFLLAEDFTPSITFGVVSGVKRYQEGQGRVLVYGNCIQIDSSINPGNSGGPLFSDDGKVLGINGRGSFEERGRVNVGLGYAISMEQILNFIPDLLATKLCMHATVDAIFNDHSDGVNCAKINMASELATAGMQLGNKLVEFDSVAIHSANQFTSVLSTYPAGWPVNIKFKNNSNEIKSVWIRLKALPYDVQKEVEEEENEDPKKEKKDDKKGEKKIKKPNKEEVDWGNPGEIRDKAMNQIEAIRLFQEFQKLANPFHQKFKKIKYEGKYFIDNKENEKFVFTYINKEKQELQITGLDLKTTSYTIDCYNNKLISEANENKNEDFRLIFEKISFLYQYSVMLNAQKTDYSGMKLVGGDKANNRRAYKLKLFENGKNFWILWLNIVDDEIKFNTQLLKLSYSQDNFESDYGEIAMVYKNFGECSFPTEINLVYGLIEKQIRQIKIEKISMEKENE